MDGILFTGGAGPDPEKARRFLSGGALVVAADSGLEAALGYGMRPDMVIGDMDSLSRLELLSGFPPDRVKRLPKDKDCTDTEAALDYLRVNGVSRVTIVGGDGGRLDHLFALKAIFERPDFPRLWLGSQSLVYAISRSQGIAMGRGLRAEDPISVFPIGPGPHACRSVGLHWPCDGLAWDSGQFSLSNRADSCEFSLEVISGRFLLIVPLDSGGAAEPVTFGEPTEAP
jgi:thiamine pyrophosphokinase